MQKPAFPANENQRIRTLQSLNVLDTPAEERLDRITQCAASLFDAPIALVSLVDRERQWFKANYGLDATETARDISFCGHTILQEGVFVVNDASQDPRFLDNPLVTGYPNIRFYAGYPVEHANGSRLGTLCIIDTKPREFDTQDIQVLAELATLVELELVSEDCGMVDTESNLSNRDGFLQLAKHSMQVCQRLDLSISVAFVYAKGLMEQKVNHCEDSYLSSVRMIADEFKANFRSSDVVARYDDSSFIALLTNIKADHARQNLKLMADRVSHRSKQHDELCSIQLVTGLIDGEPSDDIEQLIFRAFLQLHGS